MTDAKTIATEVSAVDEAVMKFLPFVSTFIGFVPGGAAAIPFLPFVSEALAALDEAAKAVAAGNPGAGISSILMEINNHLTPGKPNSPILSAPFPNMPRADTP